MPYRIRFLLFHSDHLQIPRNESCRWPKQQVKTSRKYLLMQKNSHIAGTLLKTDSTAQATIFSIRAATNGIHSSARTNLEFTLTVVMLTAAMALRGFPGIFCLFLFRRFFFGRYPPFSWLIVFNVIFLRARERWLNSKNWTLSLSGWLYSCARRQLAFLSLNIFYPVGLYADWFFHPLGRSQPQTLSLQKVFGRERPWPSKNSVSWKRMKHSGR